MIPKQNIKIENKLFSIYRYLYFYVYDLMICKLNRNRSFDKKRFPTLYLPQYIFIPLESASSSVKIDLSPFLLYRQAILESIVL